MLTWNEKATRRKGEGKTEWLDHNVAGAVCFCLAIRSNPQILCITKALI